MKYFSKLKDLILCAVILLLVGPELGIFDTNLQYCLNFKALTVCLTGVVNSSTCHFELFITATCFTDIALSMPK